MPDPAGAARYPHALRPGAIGALALPHRIVMGSMHLGSEADADRRRDWPRSTPSARAAAPA